MSLRSQVGEMRKEILCSFHRRTVGLGELGPIVTFTFDDFPCSALATGGEIIKGFGGRATYYVSMGLMGTTNCLGKQFHLSDLHSLVEEGHEVASHSFSHLSARRTPIDEFLKDVEFGENAIRASIGGSLCGNFAYPYGEVTLAVKRVLGPRMESCRGTCGGWNGPDVDLNLLRANRLYGGMDQSDVAKQLILRSEERRGWLIFYSHDVASNPSRFGCTPDLLEEVVSFAVARGIKMATVEQVVNRLCRTGHADG